MAPKNTQRSFRNFLLDDHRLPLRYALVVTLISTIISVVLGAVIYQQSTYASTQIIQGLEDPSMKWLDINNQEAIKTQLGQTDINLMVVMMGVGLGLAIILFTLLMLITHKAAGPLNRMAQYFEAIQAGHMPAVTRLRKGDYHTDTFALLRKAMVALNQSAHDDATVIQALTDTIESQQSELTEELAVKMAQLKELAANKLRFV